MKPSASSVDALAANNNKSKNTQATKSLSHKFMWGIYISSLVINDVGMTLLAYSLAYYVRFILSISLPGLSLS